MQSIIEQLNNTITKELAEPFQEQKLKDFNKLITDMRNAGLIKRPSYDLPLVDTIGKTYYNKMNKHL